MSRWGTPGQISNELSRIRKDLGGADQRESFFCTGAPTSYFVLGSQIGVVPLFTVPNPMIASHVGIASYNSHATTEGSLQMMIYRAYPRASKDGRSGGIRMRAVSGYANAAVAASNGAPSAVTDLDFYVAKFERAALLSPGIVYGLQVQTGDPGANMYVPTNHEHLAGRLTLRHTPLVGNFPKEFDAKIDYGSFNFSVPFALGGREMGDIWSMVGNAP